MYGGFCYQQCLAVCAFAVGADPFYGIPGPVPILDCVCFCRADNRIRLGAENKHMIPKKFVAYFCGQNTRIRMHRRVNNSFGLQK